MAEDARNRFSSFYETEIEHLKDCAGTRPARESCEEVSQPWPAVDSAHHSDAGFLNGPAILEEGLYIEPSALSSEYVPSGLASVEGRKGLGEPGTLASINMDHPDWTTDYLEFLRGFDEAHVPATEGQIAMNRHSVLTERTDGAQMDYSYGVLPGYESLS